MSPLHRALFAAVALLSLAWVHAPDDPARLFARRCTELSAQSRAGYRAHCAADGSLGALQFPVDAHVSQRLGATRLWDRPAAPRPRSHTEAFVSGDYVIVEHTACPECARVMGTTWMFRPAQAPAAVLEAAQTAAGLPAAPLLRTVAAWRAAR